MSPPGVEFGETYYREVYRDYLRQNPPRKLAFYRTLAERAVRGVERPRVLEVGCAFGLFLASLDRGWSLHGTDVSVYAIERARTGVAGASFAAASAVERPFAGPFDLIAAFDVLEHLPDPLAAALAIDSLLAPAGRLIFVVPVYDGPLGPLVRALDRDPTHVQKWRRDDWLAWTREHFALEDWLGVTRFLIPGGWYLHRPTRVLRAIAPAIVVIASRKH